MQLEAKTETYSPARLAERLQAAWGSPLFADAMTSGQTPSSRRQSVGDKLRTRRCWWRSNRPGGIALGGRGLPQGRAASGLSRHPGCPQAGAPPDAVCSRPIAAAAAAAIPMTVRSSLMPRTSCGARRRWTTAGADLTAVEHWNAECAGWHVCKRGDRFAALQPIPWGLPGCMARPRPARLGGWPCGWITAPGICGPLHQPDQVLGHPAVLAFVAEPQTNGVAERFNRTLKEQIIHGRIYRSIAELRDAVRDFVELYNAQWIVEKNGYLSPAQARQAWHAAISIRPAA